MSSATLPIVGICALGNGLAQLGAKCGHALHRRSGWWLYAQVMANARPGQGCRLVLYYALAHISSEDADLWSQYLAYDQRPTQKPHRFTSRGFCSTRRLLALTCAQKRQRALCKANPLQTVAEKSATVCNGSLGTCKNNYTIFLPSKKP